MPRYVSLHTLACLTRQGADQLITKITRAAGVSARQVLANTLEGKILIEFEAPDRETLDRFLASENFRPDWVWRVEMESAGGPLRLV